MKIIIMAAGKGTRISRYINGKPKCTVEIDEGKTLIEDTVEKLNKRGIDDIVLVLGYKSAEIKRILKDKVRYYENYFFDVTNSIASLWIAREELKNDGSVILMNGDVFLEESLLDDIINEKRSPILFADENRIEEADYKLKYTNGKLEKYGKELCSKEATGEYIGVAKLANLDKVDLLEKVEEMVEKQQHQLWWENALYEKVNEKDILVADINSKFWAEVDYIEDYIRIKDYIKSKKRGKIETTRIG